MKGQRRIGGLRMGCGEGLVSRVAPRLLRRYTDTRNQAPRGGVRGPGGQR